MSSEKKIFVTKEGLEKLQAELKDLSERGRQEIAARIKEAKEFGDLSENSEYHDAKEQQSFIEGRINELKMMLKQASVIDDGNKQKNQVGVGSTVVVEINGGEGQFTIVGSAEADPDQGKISNESPLGQALLDRKVGEEIEVDAPAGKVIYTIKAVR
jgi:transcription elongation factor GreA